MNELRNKDIDHNDKIKKLEGEIQKLEKSLIEMT